MLFNLRNLLPELACVLAIGQFVASAPHGDPLNTDHGLEKRVPPQGMKFNGDSGAWTVIKKKNSHFSWADQKQGIEPAKTDSNTYYRSYIASNPTHDALLISALYVPHEGIFVSSYPRNKLPTGQAPDWAKAVAGRKHDKRHVEDAALWLYESTLAADKRTHESGKYPAGSTIFTYGQFAGQEPDHQPACGSQPGSAKIDPSCTKVLTTLGVKDGNNPLHNP